MNPLVNGRAYDWAQVIARFSNSTLPFFGVTKIAYNDEQEIENNYGAGSFPSSRGFGNYKAEASITVTMEEVEKLQASVPSGRLQDIPEFDLVVSFVHPETAKIINHSVRNCRIMNNARDLNQNDKTFPIELTLVPSHIEWNGNKILGLFGTGN